MKNNHPHWRMLPSKPLVKVLRIMKLTTALLIIGCLQVTAHGFSQEARVTLSCKDVSIPQLFKVIEKKTDYRFAYSNDIVPRDYLVTISVKDSPVSSVLRTALENTGLKFDLIDDEIIVVSQEVPRATAATITGKVTDDA